MSLRDKVEKFIAEGSKDFDLESLLMECGNDGGLEGLFCVRRLFEDMYGGITFNFELKAPAAWELVVWGERGLEQLAEAALSNPTSKNMSLCIQILCCISAEGWSGEQILFCSDSLSSRIRNFLSDNPSIRGYARGKIVEVILSVEDESDLSSYVGMAFTTFSLSNNHAVKELFAAISTRWLALSKSLLERYANLIETSSGDEPAFQSFLSEHPQLLDPMATEVWPQPDLHGAFEPDFVIRRSDNSYLIVEIECPSKKLITQNGQLSAAASHAVSQVTEYQRFIENLSNRNDFFPNIDYLESLVVIGTEYGLSKRQKLVLQNENRSRHRLRIVGFDWLAERSHAIQENIIRSRSIVRPRLRVV